MATARPTSRPTRSPTSPTSARRCGPTSPDGCGHQLRVRRHGRRGPARDRRDSPRASWKLNGTPAHHHLGERRRVMGSAGRPDRSRSTASSRRVTGSGRRPRAPLCRSGRHARALCVRGAARGRGSHRRPASTGSACRRPAGVGLQVTSPGPKGPSCGWVRDVQSRLGGGRHPQRLCRARRGVPPLRPLVGAGWRAAHASGARSQRWAPRGRALAVGVAVRRRRATGS